ncbi:uncharacterized protein I206_102930 [Kwoniella pini CBS 10737]|uniref:Uncharacterized protein n=1 Tax=Kwoniella pini CBS 10737 TaxID=1296096 RepID=A0A1B9I6Q5_9TREE|nr:uncharacterized protein I206_03281 [Kwoniella pini CBS 10737]OCF51215.1 hypothetical protein I206_03281 [Kwoniella pini CBS 10737]
MSSNNTQSSIDGKTLSTKDTESIEDSNSDKETIIQLSENHNENWLSKWEVTFNNKTLTLGGNSKEGIHSTKFDLFINESGLIAYYNDRKNATKLDHFGLTPMPIKEDGFYTIIGVQVSVKKLEV